VPNVFAAPETDLPRSARGKRTRAALLVAARRMFERDGLVEARVIDIADEAGVAHGSFYTHFASKEEAFAAVMAQLQEEMLHPGPRESVDSQDPVAAIEAANRAYLTSYRRNARLMAQLEQAALSNEDFREVRIKRSRAFAQRNANGIRRLQAQGLADPDLDPWAAAQALAGMVSNMARSVFVYGQRMPFEDLVQLTTRLYANALRIPVRQ
jgi:AcrR family transcriptional regulator